MGIVFGESDHGMFMVLSDADVGFEVIDHNVGAVLYNEPLITVAEHHVIDFGMHADRAVEGVVHVEVPVLDYTFPVFVKDVVVEVVEPKPEPVIEIVVESAAVAAVDVVDLSENVVVKQSTKRSRKKSDA